jgi:hypothetical protein
MQVLVGVRHSVFIHDQFRYWALPAFFQPNRYKREVTLTHEHRRKYLQRLNETRKVQTS